MPEQVGNLPVVARQGDINEMLAQQIADMRRRLEALERQEFTQTISGTWTPADASGAGLIYTVSGNTYTRIGRIVLAAFALTFPSTASGASATIGGLPFTCEAGATMWPVVFAYPTVGGSIFGRVQANQTSFLITNQSGSDYTNAQMSLKIIHGLAIYRAA
jgi:hypothetical protein